MLLIDDGDSRRGIVTAVMVVEDRRRLPRRDNDNNLVLELFNRVVVDVIMNFMFGWCEKIR